MLDIGGYTIDSKSLAQKIIEELKEVNWKDKKIIFHFHTCDSATSPDYTEDSIKKYSLIKFFITNHSFGSYFFSNIIFKS